MIEEFSRMADLAHLEQEAHDLKSVSGNLGARRLQQLAQELEMASGAGDLPRAQAIAGRIPAIAHETRAILIVRLMALEAMADPERMVQ
jgi:HPt (histidine-containing phosphotransfer) domain-containing protein